MTKEALKLALEALSEAHYIAERLQNEDKRLEAISALKEALAQPEQEPAAWKWQQAPVKTQWGHDMVVVDFAIDKNHTVSVYCERDQTAKVEAMFTLPAAQPAYRAVKTYHEGKPWYVAQPAVEEPHKQEPVENEVITAEQHDRNLYAKYKQDMQSRNWISFNDWLLEAIPPVAKPSVSLTYCQECMRPNPVDGTNCAHGIKENA